jgi:hypothetical protein
LSFSLAPVWDNRGVSPEESRTSARPWAEQASGIRKLEPGSQGDAPTYRTTTQPT